MTTLTDINIENIPFFSTLTELGNLEHLPLQIIIPDSVEEVLQFKEEDIKNHSLRVARLTLLLAKKMGIGKEKLEMIYYGALLHDIGKINIPDQILYKPGPLNKEEWEIMQQHPIYALEILSSISVLSRVIEIPYCHHEKWDGTGYPRGLQEEEIPQAARVFSIIDVWDALTSDRPYRKAWSKDKTLEYINEQSGKHFDPKVTEEFIKLISKQDNTFNEALA